MHKQIVNYTHIIRTIISQTISIFLKSRNISSFCFGREIHKFYIGTSEPNLEKYRMEDKIKRGRVLEKDILALQVPRTETRSYL